MKNLAELFPIKKEYSYFMTSASGPLPRPTHERFCQFSSLLMETGSVRYPTWLELADSTRESAARLLNTSSQSIAFVKNTGAGLWLASRMIDWNAFDEVLLPRGEFPSNIFPWLSLEPLSVSVKWIEPQSDHPIPEVTRESVEPLISERTRLLSVSFVQFDDGARRNMQELSKLCKERNLIFVVDAIQGLGALPFDLSEFEADFVCAGSQKWLLSPPGVGVLYVHPRWMEKANVPNFGWLSLNDPFNTEPGAFSDCLARVLPDAKRFEEGTNNFAGIAALGASIDLILEFGIDTISDKVKYLTDLLVQKLLELDCRIVSPRGDSWSGIVSFDHPRLNSYKVDKQFTAEKIITTVRNDWVRVAVDFFNDEEEVQKLVDSVKSQLSQVSQAV